jgi:hypothetical protein
MSSTKIILKFPSNKLFEWKRLMKKSKIFLRRLKRKLIKRKNKYLNFSVKGYNLARAFNSIGSYLMEQFTSGIIF